MNNSLKNNEELKLKLVQLVKGDGKSIAQAARELGLGIRNCQEFFAKEKKWAVKWWEDNQSVMDDYLSGLGMKQEEGAKVLFLDLEVSASIVAAFSMFKHFSTPDHIIQFPYILTMACNWLHEPEDKVYGYKLDDFDTWDIDHKNDYELTCKLWEYLDKADIVVIQNAAFDDGWANQRFAYHGLPLPSPYRTVCTLKGLKKAMSLPSNSLGYSTKYFNLGVEKLHHEGISLWIRCMSGDLEAMNDMLTYNMGDIPTLRRLYLTIRAFIPNHPNLALWYKDKTMRCSVCGGNSLTKLESKAVSNLSAYTSYRCDDCGTVKRTSETFTTKEDRVDYLRNILK